MSTLAAQNIRSGTSLLQVIARSTACHDVAQLVLADPEGRPLPPWTPGAHVDIEVEYAGERFLRQYSLCGDPADRSQYRIGVLRSADGRGGSKAIHAALTEGALVRVGDLRNNFTFQPAADREVLFIAGGIGITPILPMVAAAQARGITWRALYLGRNPGSMAFADELAAHASEPDQVGFHYSDLAGFIDLEEPTRSLSDGTQVYVCGPEPLLSALEELQPGATWTLHLERFTPLRVDTSHDTAFDVIVASTGTSYRVDPGCSILSVLREHGITRDFSCAEGVCGTCETAVLEGVPDHRDAVLTDEERADGDYMMICVSRAKTPQLVLDL